MHTVVLILIAIIAIIIYLMPIIVAHSRNAKNIAGVTILTILLGWSLIGWVVALLWATSGETLEEYESKQRTNSNSTKSNISNQSNFNNIELSSTELNNLNIVECSSDEYDMVRIIRNNGKPEFIKNKTWNNISKQFKSDDYIILGYFKTKSIVKDQV